MGKAKSCEIREKWSRNDHEVALQEHGHPRRRHLHPQRGVRLPNRDLRTPALVDRSPVGEDVHEVETGQGEGEVEETPVVVDSVLLVVGHRVHLDQEHFLAAVGGGLHFLPRPARPAWGVRVVLHHRRG